MTKESKNDQSGQEKFDTLMNKMSDVKKKWDEEADSDDEDAATGQLLDQAIEMAIEQGRGWSPGEKEKYLESILDDDYVSSFDSILLSEKCSCMILFRFHNLTEFLLHSKP